MTLFFEIPDSLRRAPLGGVNYSGMGREGGKWGIEEFQDIRYISMRLPPA